MCLEKRNCRKRQCKKLIIENGTEITKLDKNIYTSKVDVNVQANNVFLQTNNVPKLDNIKMLKCEGKLADAEYFNVPNKMSKNKSPENDSLSCEWYLQF